MTARGPRYEAKQRGMLTYIPLTPCKKCGTSERRTDNGNCCECDRDIQRPRSYARYHTNPRKAIDAAIQYRADHLPEVRARIRKWQNERLWTDPQWRLRRIIGARTRHLFHGEIKGSLNHPDPLIGCTTSEFRKWLADEFTPEMTQENYGTIWTIDHIDPLTAFDLTKAEQFSAACCYTNTYPMFRSANIKKGGIRRPNYNPK